MSNDAYEAGKKFGAIIAETCKAGDFEKLNALEPEGDKVRGAYEGNEAELAEFEKGFMEVAGPELEKMMESMAQAMGDMMGGLMEDMGEAMGGMAEGMAQALGGETADGESKSISEEIKGASKNLGNDMRDKMKEAIEDSKKEKEDE